MKNNIYKNYEHHQILANCKISLIVNHSRIRQRYFKKHIAQMYIKNFLAYNNVNHELFADRLTSPTLTDCTFEVVQSLKMCSPITPLTSPLTTKNSDQCKSVKIRLMIWALYCRPKFGQCIIR